MLNLVPVLASISGKNGGCQADPSFSGGFPVMFRKASRSLLPVLKSFPVDRLPASL
jgi:hypothetical protein